MEWLNSLLHNTYFVWCAMAVIIFAITQLVKLPIKHFTKKISNERVRKIVNATILLIPFALGVVFDFLYSSLYLHVSFVGINGLGYGTAAISLYGVVERFFKVNVDNPYKTKEGESVLDFVQKIAADGKLDAKDAEAVQEFLDSIVEDDDDYDETQDDDEEEKPSKAEILNAVQEFLNKVNK